MARKSKKSGRENPLIRSLARFINVLTLGGIAVVALMYQMTASETANSSVTHRSEANLNGEPTVVSPLVPQPATSVTCDGIDQAGVRFGRFSVQGADQIDIECLKTRALVGSARHVDRLDDLNRCDQHVNYVKLGGIAGCMDFLGHDVNDPELAMAIASTEANHIPAKIPFCDRPKHDRKVKRILQGVAKFGRLCWTK